MADAFSAISVRTDTDGDVVVGIAAGQSVGISGTPTVTVGNASLDVNVVTALPTGANTIGNVGIVGTADVNITNASLDVAVTSALPTGTNSIGTVGLNAGSNTIGNVNLNAGTNIIGKVEVIASAGTIKHVSTPTSGNVTKNGGTSTVNSTAITNGTTAELLQITVASSVAMKAIVRTDDTLSPVNVLTVYIPAGGGQQTVTIPNGAITLAGTAAGENFDVVFTNLDTKNDAEATATFTWAEV